MAKNVLGRGLEALISSKKTDVMEEEKPRIQQEIGEGAHLLKIDEIIPGSNQPRMEFNKEKMAELVMSIKGKGIVEPIVVRKKDNKYEIIAGERRWRAAREAGFDTVPVILRNVSDKDALEMSLVENIQREDLNPLEEAKAYQYLMEQYNITHEEIARALGKDRSTVSNIIRLLKLPAEIQKEIKSGDLSMGHARALLGIENESIQKLVARKIVRRGLSVREAERLVKKASGAGVKEPAKQRDPYLIKIAEELQHIFGTKVTLSGKSDKGKIEIIYYSKDDLTRIIDTLDIRL